MSKLCLCNFSVVFLIIIFVPKISQRKTAPPITLSVDQRVKVLKFQIAEQIRNKQPKLITTDNEKDDYEYVDVKNIPMTPINEFDKRKKDEKYQLPELVTKPTTLDQYAPPSDFSKPVGRMKKRKRVKKRMRQMIKPVDTFYRRIAYDNPFYYKQIIKLFCQTLVSPILSGERKNYTTYHKGFVKASDHQIQRMIHLLTKNATSYADDELRQLLYQFSNLKIRVFEWSIETLDTVLTLLLGEHNHNFRSLKEALGGLVSSWRLDLSNHTAFMTQAKIYRPACVKVSGYEGSTQTTSGPRYSKLTSPKPPCVPKKGKICEYEYEDDGK